MEAARISPVGLVKKLVGEELTVKVALNPHFRYNIELYTNANRVKDVYKFDFTDGEYVCTLPLRQSGFFTWNVRYKREGTKTWRWINEGPRKRLTGRVQVDPEWLQSAVVYNVFVRFFSGMVDQEGQKPQPGDGGTFDDVKAHLDDLKAMGVNTLYFNPIHLIGELHRKYNMLDNMPTYWQPGSPYSIKDYKSIDPELTYDKDTKKHLLSDPHQEFRDLIEAAHERNMSVIMDLVFNHTAHDFVFQRIRPEWYLYKENITSLTDPYLYPEDMKDGKPWGDARHTMAPYDHDIWWEDAAQLNWEFMIPEGPNPAPKNPSLKEMWEYFKSIPKYWIRHFGVDGFRCDIAYRVPPEFWKACIAEAREEAMADKNNLMKDVIFIAETFTNNLLELQEAGFTAVYGDYSNKLHHPRDLTGYLEYMYNLSGQHFPEGSKWFIFPEGHDFNRTPAKVLGSENVSPEAAFRANASRWLITATLPGIPLIFNGFEKVEWKPVNLFGYGAVDWNREADLRDFIAKVNQLRIKLPQLHLTAGYTPLTTNQGMNEKTQLIAYLRHKDEAMALVVVNMDVYSQAGPAVIYLPERFAGAFQMHDELTGETFTRNGRELTIVLPPGAGHVFSIQFL
jgi:glycosidase